MSRPVFSFRPNLGNPEHKKAWEILQGVPEGQKNSYLVRLILQDGQEGRLEEMIRRTVREEIGDSAMKCQSVQNPGELPGQMLEFLSRMEQGD